MSGYSGSAYGSDNVHKKYYVHVKKVNGEFELTLEETDDYLPTEALLSVYAERKSRYD